MLFDDIVCRAQRKDSGEWIEGYYFCLHHNDERTHIHHMLIPVGADLSLGTPIEKIQVEVIPESIKLKNQEPHVITEDDFSQCDDFGYIPAVFEPRDMPTFVSDYVVCCLSGVEGVVIKQYYPTACEQQTMIRTSDGRLYHAPTRTFQKLR